MQKILIFNVNWLGDVVFSTPAIRAIKKAYPDSYMACLVVPRCREILETNPHLDEVIDFDEDGAHRSLIGKIKLIRQLRAKKFDVAFLLHGSFSRALITALAGIPWRVGYATKRHRRLILGCYLAEPKRPVHKVNYFLNLVRVASKWGEGNKKGISVAAGNGEELIITEPGEEDYEVVVSPEMRVLGARALKSCGLDNPTGKFAVLNPGANWLPKRWTVDGFAKTGDLITEKTGMPVVITGAQKDLELAEKIAGKMKTKPVITCGQTDIKALAGILKLSDVVVSADSGPMHLAVAVGARVVTIFGPTSPELTGPRGSGNYTVIHKDIECEVPCYDRNCEENVCMQLVKPEEVLEAILHPGQTENILY